MNIIITFVAAYILLLILMVHFQRSLMYFPQPDIPQAAAEKMLPDGRMVHVITEDDLILKSYFVPPRNSTKPIILVFHGNAGLGIYLSPYFADMLENGYGVLFAEYRGYGGNPGEPTEKGLYKDADAYLLYLQEHYPKTKVIAYGQSLGSGPAVDLVSRNPQSFMALILEAPFDSALNVADSTYPYIFFKKWKL